LSASAPVLANTPENAQALRKRRVKRCMASASVQLSDEQSLSSRQTVKHSETGT
jgi:hypothetical protein